VGTNGRLDTLQAAVMLAKFPHFPAEVEARGRIGARYSELLGELGVSGASIIPPSIMDGNTHVYAQYTVRVPADQRDEICAKLKENGIPTGVYYPACFHEQPVFEHLGYKWGDFPESERASREVLSLPMHPWLTEEEQQKIVREVLDILLF
jgi:UDP-2-acetamido-2-deoxy-ribo-hexuluronate aminotransferase